MAVVRGPIYSFINRQNEHRMQGTAARPPDHPEYRADLVRRT